uniref:Uncharacterized protein n=2 Tax=Neobodo designis TaxID=312471 RepID=A0A7S1MS21_NEODS|mmetsp:Transcript_46154/g.142260  ORF Transcript_46154/g.142260 Transcript_46154/m.142260 type:complete len:421 (+) Transcript_46154:70-1332(+)
MFGRQASLFRRCVPFKFYASGPVAAVAQRTFERYPHTFTLALEALEELDTAPLPRMMMAEALQAMAQGNVEQRVVRELFEQAELAARDEANGGLDHERWVIDPEYRLWTYQLHMAAGYWERMLRVQHQPWMEAQYFIDYRYAGDVSKDGVIKRFTDMMLSEDGRGEITDDIDDLYEMIFILERDLYGQFRLDKRSDQLFMIHSLKITEVGRNPETAEAILGGVKAVQRAGHFDIRMEEQQGRWKQYFVSCKPEDDPAPWDELIEVPEMRAWRNPNHPKIDCCGRPKQVPAKAMSDTPQLPEGEKTPAMVARERYEAARAAADERGRETNLPAPTATDPKGFAAALGTQPAALPMPVVSHGFSPVSHEELADNGYVRVYFEHPAVPRKNPLKKPDTYDFELAIPKREVGWAPRKLGEVYGI